MSDSEEDQEYEYSSCDNHSDCEDDFAKDERRMSVVNLGVEANSCEYSILSYEEVTPIMRNLITEVCNLLDVSEPVSEVLLRNFKWNKELLLNEYFSAEETFWSKAGVPHPRSSKIGGSGSSSRKGMATRSMRREVFFCAICCDHDCPIADSFGLDCGHLFCKACYGGYLQSGIGDGPACVRLTCPQHQCQQAISSAEVSVLCSEEAYDTYSMYLTRNFIETSTSMRWCPSPGCRTVALRDEHADGDINITCSDCSNEFCFRCGSPSHPMLTCDLLEKWQLKCSSESENCLWLMSNTKKCPGCKHRIEKNGGCMHMSCKMCKHGFCWHCLQPWAAEGHTWNHATCSVHVPPEEATGGGESLADLERYVKYFSRYDGHDKSIKFAGAQRERAAARMASMMAVGQGRVFVDVEFVLQAVEQVIAGRKALKYAYAFMFFLLDGTVEKALFEHALEMLERHIEALSQLTEEGSVCAREKGGKAGGSGKQVDRDRCINLTSAIKKSLASLVHTRKEQSFQFRC